MSVEKKINTIQQYMRYVSSHIDRHYVHVPHCSVVSCVIQSVWKIHVTFRVDNSTCKIARSLLRRKFGSVYARFGVLCRWRGYIVLNILTRRCVRSPETRRTRCSGVFRGAWSVMTSGQHFGGRTANLTRSFFFF